MGSAPPWAPVSTRSKPMSSNFIKTSGYVVALILVSGLGACGGGGSGTADSSGYGSGNVNARPSLSVASSIQVDENQTAVTVVSASDADGDDLSFSLSGDDAKAFEIDSDGTLRFITAPDFEVKSSYSVTVEVSDGSDTTAQMVAIEIVDLAEAPANSAPVIVGLDATVQVNENQSNLLALEVSDADEDALTYSLEGVDAAAFEVTQEGVISFVSAPDYEAQAVFEVTIVVSDGTDQTRQQLSVQIIDVAEAQTQAPVEFNLVVARGTNSFGTGNKYSINNNISPDLNLEIGKTYRLLQSDGSNATHPVYFSTTPNGIHGGGVEFSEGVSRVSATGSSGAYVQFTVPEGLTTLYYYCLNYSGMGGTITISSSASGAYVVPMN